ncbi:hypothetical protein RRG08_056405 [Elysia crispata]|uniref:Uncharacterized protein n=1 Tax=Elysia crispata TaxID=231223 RepID=A0AAE0YZV9_9GAST|nr:hypothetical protein RRG08_056405 [Elysia crispata]
MEHFFRRTSQAGKCWKSEAPPAATGENIKRYANACGYLGVSFLPLDLLGFLARRLKATSMPRRLPTESTAAGLNPYQPLGYFGWRSSPDLPWNKFESGVTPKT